MTATQTQTREDFCRRVLELPEENFFQIKQYLDDMLPRVSNAETVKTSRTGFLKGRLTIPKDFDRMCETEISEIFSVGK